MKKTIFVYIFNYILVIFLISACDTNKNGATSENTASTESDTILVEQGEEETEDADAVDLVLLTFMNNRLQYHMSEIAAEKASSTSVKELAEAIMKATEEVRVDIEQLAQTTNTDLPEAIGADQRMILDSIQNLSQSEFDKAYLAGVVAELEENTDRLNRMLEKDDNPITAGLAAEIKETQDEHQEKAEALLEELS
ncbi:DUF4142 domain-containing protein [Porifericola rhodea]|uniref:DUF4142 domain-containing protein n=1 Tax=Porifericola rhodea TaxID=930972 RepID=UPI002665A2BF|nr:DUF4142 domain-containing protein [Porifericola rhodea]WKN31818.1 DUF4142 domain-containing protein [Porifericola rhodea]